MKTTTHIVVRLNKCPHTKAVQKVLEKCSFSFSSAKSGPHKIHERAFTSVRWASVCVCVVHSSIIISFDLFSFDMFRLCIAMLAHFSYTLRQVYSHALWSRRNVCFVEFYWLVIQIELFSFLACPSSIVGFAWGTAKGELQKHEFQMT